MMSEFDSIEEELKFLLFCDEEEFLDIAKSVLSKLARLNSCRAQSVPDGWVRVPVDPTPAMVSAYLAAQKAKAMASDMAWGVSDPAENFKAGFSAMIAAAPPSQQKEG